MLRDKELYRTAYDQYRQWNDAEIAIRIRNGGRLSSISRFRGYKRGDVHMEKRLEPSLRTAIAFLEAGGYPYAIKWGKLDEVYIENWLTQFAEALDKPEY